MERLKILLVILMFSTFSIQAQHTIEKIGDVGLYSMPFVALGTTFLKKDKPGAYAFSKAFVLNTVVTLGLKEITHKERPNGEDFKSFPSGHTSITFQGAAFLQKRYGWDYGIPAYAVAAFTGFSRVYAKKHYVEDVAVGAAFGILSSYIFTKKLNNDQVSFSFGKKGKDYCLSYHYQF